MPVLDGIDSRIRRDPVWKRTAKAAAKQSRITATQIPLVHVTGKPRFPFLRLCTEYAGKIPTSDDTDYGSPATRRKDHKFGWGPSLHFYPGRAHEGYGDVALGFAPSVEEGHTGSVTTTGYYAAADHAHLPCNDPALRKSYIAASTYALGPHETMWVPPWPTPLRPRISKIFALLRVVPRLWCSLHKRLPFLPKPRSFQKIPRWRAFFAIMLGAYFPNNRNYWEGRPFRDDPDGIFREVDDWRAWTFEVRFSEPVSIENVKAWCPRPEAWDEIQQKVLRAGFPGADAVPEALVDLVSNSEILDSRGSPEYAKRVERWAQEQCGL